MADIKERCDGEWGPVAAGEMWMGLGGEKLLLFSLVTLSQLK